MSKAKPAFTKADEGTYFLSPDALWMCQQVYPEQHIEQHIEFYKVTSGGEKVVVTFAEAVARGFTRLLPEKKRERQAAKKHVVKRHQPEWRTDEIQARIDARRAQILAQRTSVSQKQEGEGDEGTHTAD